MRRDLLIGLVLAALTLGVYWPVRTHDFILYDDPEFITENLQVRSGLSWKTVQYAFTEPLVGNWHPVTTLSHALDCELFGIRPGPHHLVNALIHSINAALLFLLLQRLVFGGQSPLGRAYPQARRARRSTEAVHDQSEALPGRHGLEGIFLSVTAALLFALHPLRVESVAWIAERKDLLSGFFFLFTLWMYTRYAEAPAKQGETGKVVQLGTGAGFYFGSLLCFALGLMSKPMVVTVPFVLLLMDFWPLGRFGFSEWKSEIPNMRRLITEKVPFFVLSIIDCWITLHVQRNAGAMQMVKDVSWFERISNATTSYVRYLGKLFWPADLSIVYPHPGKHYFLSDAWPGWEVVCAALFLVLFTVFCFQQACRRPFLLFGWLWFLGTLVPVIGLVQVGEQAMADRYTYIPLIGPLIALICCLRPVQPGTVWRLNPVAAASLAGVFIVVLTGLTRRQLGYWQDTVTLFGHAIEVTADNPSAQFALGVGLEGQGQLGKALVHYRVATSIDPNYGKAWYNLGQALRKQGYWPEAVKAYLAAARCNSNDLPTQLNLASALPHVGRNRDAITHFERSLELDPKSIEALNNLAWLLATSPDAPTRNGMRAVQLAEQACAITGYRAPFLLGTLAAAYAEAGRFNDAILAGEQACARANEMGDSAAVAKNKELLELYRANRPYRDATSQ